MNVGQERGQVVVDLIHQSRPKLMVELGGYIGFSAIKFGNAVRAAGGIQYLSFEKSPENAAVAKVLLELAGLDEFVRVVVGPSTQSLRSLAQQKQWTGIDFLFLDHWEELYLPDLKLIEEQDLLKVGSLIVADNTGNPKTEAYLEWVRSTSETKRKISRGSTLESCGSFLYESKSYNFRLPDGTQVRLIFHVLVWSFMDADHICNRMAWK